MMHLFGYISLKDLNWKSRPYSAWPAYGQSKLANLLFTSELQRRLDAAGSRREGARRPPRLLGDQPAGPNRRPQVGDACDVESATRLVATDADFGARQTLYAASQDLPGNTFVGPGIRDARPHRASPPAARWPATPRRRPALWELSEQLTDTKFAL